MSAKSKAAKSADGKGTKMPKRLFLKCHHDLTNGVVNKILTT